LHSISCPFSIGYVILEDLCRPKLLYSFSLQVKFCQTLRLENLPFSGVHLCLFNIFGDTLHTFFMYIISFNILYLFYINWSVAINIEFCNLCMSLELTSSMYRWVLPTANKQTNKQTNKPVSHLLQLFNILLIRTDSNS